MCSGVEIKGQNAIGKKKVLFSEPGAAFPVILETGEELGYVRWGRSSHSGTFPEGGWVDEESVARGDWKHLKPTPAVGLAKRYMTYDVDHVPQWFDIGPGQALKCFVVSEGEEQRVYVVTSHPPDEYQWIRDRWPQLAHKPHSHDTSPG